MKKLLLILTLLALTIGVNAQVKVLGQIAPNSTSDTYPTHEDTYGKGGLIVVSSWQDRNAIAAQRRKAGMLVRVKSSTVDSTYTLGVGLTNEDWTPFSVSADLSEYAKLMGENVFNGQQRFNWITLSEPTGGAGSITAPNYLELSNNPNSGKVFVGQGTVKLQSSNAIDVIAPILRLTNPANDQYGQLSLDTHPDNVGRFVMNSGLYAQGYSKFNNIELLGNMTTTSGVELNSSGLINPTGALYVSGESGTVSIGAGNVIAKQLIARDPSNNEGITIKSDGSVDNKLDSAGLKYADNYRTKFTDLSLVDKKYVDSVTAETVGDVSVKADKALANVFTANNTFNSGLLSSRFNGSRPITGAIGTGLNPNTNDIVDWLNAVFYPSQVPTATLTGGSQLELHSSGTFGATLNWSAGRQAATENLSTVAVAGTNQTFSNPAAGSIVSGTQDVTVTYNSNITYTNTVTTSDGKAASATTSFTFLPKRYWGRTANTAANSTEILASAGGSSVLSSSKAGTFTITASGSNRVFYAYPSNLGDLTSINIGGLESLSSFTKTVVALTNASGYTQNYNIYTSNNETSGNVTATIQ